MAIQAKSKEELAMVKLRMQIIKQMELCVSENEVTKVSSFASALSMLPVYLDYEE